MKLFYILVCSLAITLVAQAADQDQSSNKNKKKAHQGATMTSHQKDAANAGQSPSQGKAQTRQHRASTARNSNAAQSRSKGKAQTRQHGASTAQNSNAGQSRSKGKPQTRQHGASTAQNNSVPAAQSRSKGKAQTRQHAATTAQNNNVRAAQSRSKGKVQIRQFNLSNSPNSKIESVQFKPNYRIQNSETWQGQQYVAFQNYRGTWHDQGWWNNNYNRIVLISGGWYFLNAGYWYPAWGYNPAAAYYPYNGPIYAYNNLPPNQVIANVQSTLHAQGYYQGEVDGLLGPITRSALGRYQRDNSLYTTEAIDEPTLRSLGMS
jgi:Putative peptidoglycan binding domain